MKKKNGLNSIGKEIAREARRKYPLEAKLEALPDVTRGRARVWTKEQDDLILKYVPTKGQPAVAAILNLKYETVRRRYKELRDRA